MRTYIIRRVLLLIPTFFLVTILVFLSVRFIPGDPVDLLMFRMSKSSGGGRWQQSSSKFQNQVNDFSA